MDALGFLRRDLTTLTRKVASILDGLSATNQAQTQAIQAVNAKTQRAGAVLTNVATGLTTTTLSWSNPWPDTAYGVYTSLITGGAALGTVSATLVSGSKTQADCQILVNNTSGGVLASVGLDVLGVRT